MMAMYGLCYQVARCDSNRGLVAVGRQSHRPLHQKSSEALDQLRIEQRPQALTEAALEPCSGGAFHPGVELSYYLRLPALYARNTDPNAEVFRIARGNRNSLVQDVGTPRWPRLTFR